MKSPLKPRLVEPQQYFYVDTRWPIGWSLLGAFGISSVLWWGIISAGAALTDNLFVPLW